MKNMFPLYALAIFGILSAVSQADITAVNAPVSSENESPAGLILELAKTSGVTMKAFDCDRAILAGTKKSGFVLNFSRHRGEGTETCKARYSREGALQDIDCSFESVTDSMEEENSRTVIKAQRFFDPVGVITKVSGSYKETRLRDRKVMRERKLKATTDETLERLTKPLIKIPPELLESVKR